MSKYICCLIIRRIFVEWIYSFKNIQIYSKIFATHWFQYEVIGHDEDFVSGRNWQKVFHKSQFLVKTGGPQARLEEEIFRSHLDQGRNQFIVTLLVLHWDVTFKLKFWQVAGGLFTVGVDNKISWDHFKQQQWCNGIEIGIKSL